MSGEPRPVRLVLDTSAIVAFTGGSVPVGELIAEVDDEKGLTGLPALCLAEASRLAVDEARLTLLVNHSATVLLDLPAEDWRSLGTSTYEVIGRADAASAVLAAVWHDCDVLTAVPALYAGLDEGGPILPIEE
ncbi:hypothetical protein [Micromonospora aurantiaca (nom. illeg.)]|uniref:hypothetical protein n=1 Tax=Micromonospora aurantiaca (nom. illeg.) TaxID=47850 RepID=UPI0033C10B3D